MVVEVRPSTMRPCPLTTLAGPRRVRRPSGVHGRRPRLHVRGRDSPATRGRAALPSFRSRLCVAPRATMPVVGELTNTASGVAAAAAEPLDGDAVASGLTIAVHTKCSTPSPNHIKHVLVSLCIEELGFDDLLKICSWDAMPHWQPWPLPEQFGMQGIGVQLRPRPWPSFIARRVRMLVLNRDKTCFKVHYPVPACVRVAVSNMNVLFHDGASILLALVTESSSLHLWEGITSFIMCS